MACKKSIHLCLSFLLIATFCFAQNIKLKDVARFEFVQRPFWGFGYKKIEVVQAKGGWEVAYILRSNALKLDSSRSFIKYVPASILTQLLKIINSPDTGINIKLFKIDQTELISKIDTIVYSLKPQQRAQFVKSINSPGILKEAFDKAISPIDFTERTYYGITVFTKDGKKTAITASNFSEFYYLPWHINNIKSNDPNLSFIFNYIAGYNSYPAQESRILYFTIAYNIYWKFFQTQFNWENLKTDQPAIYSLLNGTLYPVTYAAQPFVPFMRSKPTASEIYFQSSLLPPYMQIRAYINDGDTAKARQIKSFEDTIVTAFKKGNFLFDYLKTRPNAKVTFLPAGLDPHGKSRMEAFRKYIPEIENYSNGEVQLLEVNDTRDIYSKWLLLPNNNLILFKFQFEKVGGNIYSFMNIDPEVLNNPHDMREHYPCVVFDAAGKVIHSYKGETDWIIY